MNTVIYESVITEIGEDVEDFKSENMIIIFNDTVPDELKSIAVIHKQAEILGVVDEGDYLHIGNDRFQIIHVGEKVNETLRYLGHCTILFSENIESALPGTMHVESKPIPHMEEDMSLKFVKQ